jgi:hypothetical protein
MGRWSFKVVLIALLSVRCAILISLKGIKWGIVENVRKGCVWNVEVGVKNAESKICAEIVCHDAVNALNSHVVIA